jgi:hypothetical protein
LTIGTNGSLASHYSALRAANAYIDGTASFSDYATEDFDQLWLRSGGTLNLTSGTMTLSNLTFLDTATFTQSGGTHIAQSINLPVVINPFSGATSGSYSLQGGTLVSKQLTLGYGVGPLGSGDGRGTLTQSGGVHSNSTMTMGGYYHPGGGTLAGKYRLEDGLLVSSSISCDGGSFVQNGGTNIVQEFAVHGGSYCALNGGELVTSNTTADEDTYVGGWFVQGGGKHIVQGRMHVGYSYGTGYELSGGDLVVSNLEISVGRLDVSSNGNLATANITLGGQLSVFAQGTVSNAGVITVSGDSNPSSDRPNLILNQPGETQQFGQLQISNGCAINYYAPSNPSAARFADSHASPWTGPLYIWYLGLNSGAHIFFGTNAQGLTAAQLAQVVFEASGVEYSAALLPTGELVPAIPPPLEFSRRGDALVLSWPGGYELVTATNVQGPYVTMPGAVSPMTNKFNEPQRYFRLRLPGL